MKQLVLSEWLLTQLNNAGFPVRMPNHRRIYEVIRRAITSQVLPAGARLSSTRRLAEDLSVSRNTILAAFEQLLDEGYVASRTGSGTYVTYNHSDNFSKLKIEIKNNDYEVIEPEFKKNIPTQTKNSNALSKRGMRACANACSQNKSNQNHWFSICYFHRRFTAILILAVFIFGFCQHYKLLLCIMAKYTIPKIGNATSTI